MTQAKTRNHARRLIPRMHRQSKPQRRSTVLRVLRLSKTGRGADAAADEIHILRDVNLNAQRSKIRARLGQLILGTHRTSVLLAPGWPAELRVRSKCPLRQASGVGMGIQDCLRA